MENRDKEYERIKLLFEESLPELSSEKSFVAKVETGIQGIELVKANIEASKRGNKISGQSQKCGLYYYASSIQTA